MMFVPRDPHFNKGTGFSKQTLEKLPPAIRNPFCRRYERCLNEAARHNMTDIDCRRCYFRRDKSGTSETEVYAAAYLELARVIMQGVSWQSR